MERKKKILIHSNGHDAFTGFGKNIKNVLTYLYKTGKYDLVEAANQAPFFHPSYELTPWKKYGTMPESNGDIDSEISKSPDKRDLILRRAAYGDFGIDRLVSIEKPDLYIGIEDCWAFWGYPKIPYPQKNWWNKTNCMIWTTLDSLPLSDSSISLAKGSKHFYVWSEFAEKALKKKGVCHAGTLHGAMDCSHFHRLPESKKLDLRKKSGISEDCFVSGFVFRNQLRKTVGDLLEALSIFQKRHPNIPSKVILHTSWSEGWPLPSLIKELELKNEDILTTYSCPECRNYKVLPYKGEKQECPFCHSKDSFSTSGIKNGVTEEQLNEIYNLMDLYVHPFTSGGQEIPIQEAKLAGLITAVTNYSCGEDMCAPSSGSIALDWAPYKEINTAFTKASTKPESIYDAMVQVLKMSPKDRNTLGDVGSKFVVENYSIASVGKKLEDLIDSLPEVSYGFDFLEPKRNASYSPNYQSTDVEFIQECYKGILGLDVDEGNNEIQFWAKRMKEGEKRETLHNNLVLFVKDEAEKIKARDVLESLDPKDLGKRLLVIIPNDTYLAFLYSFFVKSIKKIYPDHNIYISVDGRLKALFQGIRGIHAFMPLDARLSNLAFSEGTKDKSGAFDIVLSPTIQELSYFQHSHGGKDRSGL